MRNIILNRIKTPDGTVLTSHSVHDYVSHKDANGYTYSTDGGREYLHRTINAEAPYEDLTVYSDDPWEKVREAVYRGSRGKEGNQPLTWVPLSEMSDDYVKACIQYNKERDMDATQASNLYKKELGYRVNKGIKIDE